MLTSQKVIDAINEQIGYEFSAELQYYAIAAHFAGRGAATIVAAFLKPCQVARMHRKRLTMMEKIRFADAEARVEARATVAIFGRCRVARCRAAVAFCQSLRDALE